MTTADVKRLALVLAIQAEIEAMKAYNAAHPDGRLYSANEFWQRADQLRELAAKHDDQL